MSSVGGVQGSGTMSMLMGIAQIEAEMLKHKASGGGSPGDSQFAQVLGNLAQTLGGMSGAGSSSASPQDDESVDMSADDDMDGGGGGVGSANASPQDDEGVDMSADDDMGGGSGEVQDLLKLIQQLTDMLSGSQSDDSQDVPPMSGMGGGGGGGGSQVMSSPSGTPQVPVGNQPVTNEASNTSLSNANTTSNSSNATSNATSDSSSSAPLQTGKNLPSAGTTSLDPSGNNLRSFVENNPSSKPMTIQWTPNAGSGTAQTFTIPPGKSMTFTLGTNGTTVGGAFTKDNMRQEVAVNANDPNNITVAGNLSSIDGMGCEATMTDNQGQSFNTGDILQQAEKDVAAGKAPADILTKDANGNTELVGYYDGSTQAMKDVGAWEQQQMVDGKPFAGQSYVTPISDGSAVGPGNSSMSGVAGYNPMTMGATTAKEIDMSFSN